MSGTRISSMLCWASVLAALALLSACSDASHLNATKAWVAHIESRPVPPLPPLPRVRPPAPFAYDARLTDPFGLPSGMRAAATPESGSPDPQRPRQLLEHYSLKQLAMAGSIVDIQGQIVALVQTPDHLVHRVRLGMYMGKHEGKVTRITPHAITLQTVGPNGRGGWTSHTVVFAMTKGG